MYCLIMSDDLCQNVLSPSLIKEIAKQIAIIYRGEGGLI